MKYQAEVNVCGAEVFVIQAPSAETLALMLEVFTAEWEETWSDNEVNAYCLDKQWIRIEVAVIFFSTVQ